jgi:lysophosphatidylcholine acyltransferase/lyso-PAF acetyltransferase
MLITYMNFVSVVGRIEAKDVLIFGNLTDLCQPIYVNREDAHCRSQSFDQIKQRVNSPLPWPQLSMFTEGTTTNGRALIKFKTGAFRPGKPVQPVCFVYDQTIMDTATWTWDCPHWALLSWLSLCQIHSPVEFIFMPTYYPSEAEVADPELFAENVRRAMSVRMGVPLSDYSYEDARVAHRCMRSGLPSESGLVQINKLKREVK